MLPLLLLVLHAGSSARLVDLRCEYQRDPVCIEAAAPRLSWKTETTQRGWIQSAYQVLVASSPDKLTPARADLWNTRRVASGASIQIPYGGSPLTSGLSCYWKVRVWDNSGRESAWSQPQEWEMGLLSEGAWKNCQWIGGNPQIPDPAPAPYLRKQFQVNGEVLRARVYACGLGYAELHLNGKKMGDASERDPGYTDFDKRVLYVAHDVTGAIHQGQNTLGAILGSGWYDVHDIATWHFEKAPWRGRPRVRLVMFIDFANGHTQVVSSDSSWKTATGPILTDGIYTGETYDARLEMPGWDSPGFDDRSWKPAPRMAAPKGALVARECPPVEILQTIPAKQIRETRPGIYLVDFGQNMSGHVRLRLSGPTGAKIAMRYSERVRPDGSIDRSQIDQFMEKTTPPQPFQTDTYICKGKGVEEWEQRFSYSGFRYAEVTGFPGKPTLGNFQARFVGTKFEPGGSFSCSNELLNKIQRATLYSYQSNAQSIPTDCPQREKNGWTGDAQLACETGLMNFKSVSFYEKWLNDLADNQQPTGALSVIVPSGGWGMGGCNPAWDSAFLIVADDLYRYCGDERALALHYQGMRRYVDFLYGQTKDGLVPFDSLGDWVPWKTQTPSQITSTILLYVDARIVAKAAHVLGNEADARKYEAIAARVRNAFAKRYLSLETIESQTQTTLAMASYFGLADRDVSRALPMVLARSIAKEGHLDTGILGAKFVLRALSENLGTPLAYSLVESTQQPSWGWWIEQGATTLWEDWKGESSLNHIMFGDVSNWMYQWIAGIRPDPLVPGFRHVLMHPEPNYDLTWAQASVDGPYGRISSRWWAKCNPKGPNFHLDIEIPPNSSATVVVPGVAHTPPGVKLLRMMPGSTKFEVGSGHYHFDSDIALVHRAHE